MRLYDGRNDKKIPNTCHTVTLTSVGRCYPADVTTIRKNGRGDFSLFFCESGRIHFENPNTEVLAGQVLLYPPNIPQKYIVYASEQTVYHYLHFTGVKTDELIRSLTIPMLLPVPAKPQLMLGLFKKIGQASLYDDAYSKVTAEHLILRLLTLLAKTPRHVSRKNMMLRVTDLMEHSYPLPYDAAKFAQTFSISVSRFNHLFKEVMGVSPLKYYIQLRMENACMLLECTDLTVTEIGERVGYTDPLYFGKLFKKHTGLSPRAYRKLC